MPTADSPNPYMCETTDYTAYAILIRKTNNCHGTRSGNVLYILFFAVDFSQQKKGEASRTQSYSGTPCLHFDKLDTSRTMERTFLLTKRGGPRHSLVTGAVFRPENQDLDN